MSFDLNRILTAAERLGARFAQIATRRPVAAVAIGLFLLDAFAIYRLADFVRHDFRIFIGYVLLVLAITCAGVVTVYLTTKERLKS